MKININSENVGGNSTVTFLNSYSFKDKIQDLPY